MSRLVGAALAAGCLFLSACTSEPASPGSAATAASAESPVSVSLDTASGLSSAQAEANSSAPSPTPSATTDAASGSSSSAASALPGDQGVAGVNRPGCTSAYRPVLLLHGTVSRIAVDFPPMVAALLDAGFCVFGIDYGSLGTQSVRTSASTFADFIRAVQTETGASTVAVVGFSQGGLVLRTALRLDGIAEDVSTAVLIAPSFHGTTSPLVSAVPSGVCPACADQAAGSPLLSELSAGGDLDGAVRYAVAVSSADIVVTPWQAQIPDGPPDRVRSVVLEQQCANTRTRHQDLVRDPGVIGWTLQALEKQGDVAAADLECTAGTK